MNARWTSRKFIVSLLAQLAAMAVLFLPNQASSIDAIASSVTALLVMLLSALGYLKVEGDLDKAPPAATGKADRGQSPVSPGNP